MANEGRIVDAEESAKAAQTAQAPKKPGPKADPRQIINVRVTDEDVVAIARMHKSITGLDFGLEDTCAMLLRAAVSFAPKIIASTLQSALDPAPDHQASAPLSSELERHAGT